VQKTDLIKKLLQESEIYHSQGLLTEARNKLREAADAIRVNGGTRRQANIFQAIINKINNIEIEIAKIEKASNYRKITPQTWEAIKKTLSISNDENISVMEGAVALAKFGRIDEAVKEFRRLIAYDHLRLAAAKNILRCLIASASIEKAVSEFKDWLCSGSFPPDQLGKIRSFLTAVLKMKNALIPLPEIPTAVAVEKIDAGEEEEVFLDITSVEFTLPEEGGKGRRIELEVGFQNKCILHLIVPDKEQKRIGCLTEFQRIDDMQFYSPGAIFNGAAIVVAKSRIEEGPKKGCLAVDLKMLND
jgi:hypothetical protein